jgi:hypothetical protein
MPMLLYGPYIPEYNKGPRGHVLLVHLIRLAYQPPASQEYGKQSANTFISEQIKSI